jgi:uncharacterized membrane protein
MNVIFKPSFRGRFAPHFAPVFAPKILLGRRTVAPVPGAAQPHMGMVMRMKHQVRQGTYILGSIGLGAGLMYLFDPDRGRRRRAMARDSVTRLVHQTGQGLDKGLRDLSNRVSGKVMEAVSILSPRRVDDTVLQERIRTALGRCVTHPHAVNVEVASGRVTLTGHILQEDVEPLLNCLQHIKGVQGVRNEMQVHETPGSVPDLQGKPHLPRERAAAPWRWTPAARLTAAAAGSFLSIYGMARRGVIGMGCGLLGTAVAVRALKRPPDHSFASRDVLECGVDLQKTITIDVPLERVFRMLANPENFPQFMSHVVEVKKADERLYRWKVSGPAGAVVHWETEVTELVENTLLAWKTRPGSEVEHAGVIRFDPTAYGGTRVHVRLSFRPPLGRFGMAVGELFRWYPKHMLDQDLARFKSLLEQGKTTAHHEKVRLQDIAG